MNPLLAIPAEFAALLQRFFAERLLQQQNASPRTIVAYRDTFRLLCPMPNVRKASHLPSWRCAISMRRWYWTSSTTSKPNVTTRCAAAVLGSRRCVPLPNTWPCSARRPCNSRSRFLRYQ